MYVKHGYGENSVISGRGFVRQVLKPFLNIICANKIKIKMIKLEFLTYNKLIVTLKYSG